MSKFFNGGEAPPRRYLTIAAVGLVFLVVFLQVAVTTSQQGGGVVSGELRRWHRISVTFDGPMTNENANPNPFTDYRLNVTFTNGGRSITVPGFYAADGNAANSSATSGNKWRVHFTPDAAGTWTYTASFRQGSNIAINLDANAGSPTGFNGASGSFNVQESDKSGSDFRAHGLLRYVGGHYFQFAGSGRYFIKGGADSPENLLAYYEFDGTYDTGGIIPNFIHRFDPHAGDFRSGDPTWGNGRGRNLIGALNYLAGQGMNSVYFLTYNIDGGDGADTWMWTSHNERNRFDVSKLDQWEVVFSHMDRLGIQLHVVTQEMENDRRLGGSSGLNNIRQLYYRELVARFGHHLAVIWNLGEENDNSTSEQNSFAQYIRSLDPYDHPITVHTYYNAAGGAYNGVWGNPNFEAASLQGDAVNYNRWAIELRQRSASSGRPWAIYGDEQGPAVDDNMNNLDELRRNALWGNLMGGGAGVEWYFGYQGSFGDLQSQSWRVAEPLWRYTRHALTFFQTNLPFWQMTPNNALASGGSNVRVLAQTGQVYAIYFPNGVSGGQVDLGSSSGTFSVQWYDPRNGGALQNGSVTSISGGGWKSIGNPPSSSSSDWAVVVRASGQSPTPTPPPGGGSPTATPVSGSGVVSFSLINADTEQPFTGYETIVNGVTINLAALPTRNLSIRANTNPATVGSVRFGLNSNANYATENAAPYAIAGDDNGDFALWTYTLGAYTLTGTAFSGANAGGSAMTPLTVSFTLVDQAVQASPTPTRLSPTATPTTGAIPTGNRVVSFSLINADTERPFVGYDAIPNGAVINVATLPTRNLSIRANTNPPTVGSVRFGLNGNANFATENVGPYALAGDTNGNFAPWAYALQSYTVTGTPFGSRDATGTAGTALTISFTFVNQAQLQSAAIAAPTLPPTVAPTTITEVVQPSMGVVSFSLINADSNQAIPGYETLPNGAVIDVATLPTRSLSLRANTNPPTVGSVVFGLNDNPNYVIESTAPYALAGDSSGDFNPWSYSAGTYTVTGTAFSDAQGAGTASAPFTISFTFVDGTQPVQPTATPRVNGAPIAAGDTAVTQIDTPVNIPVLANDFDPDGEPLNPRVTAANANVSFNTTTSQMTYVPNPGFTGQDSFTYEICDPLNACASAVVVVTVNGAILPTSAPTGSAILSFSLVDADTNQVIPGYEYMVNGAVIDLATLPTRSLTIIANPGAEPLTGVRFGLNENSNYRTEGAAPYALGGDTNVTDFQPWNYTPGTTYTLTATPLAASGTPGTPLTITFTLR